MSRARNLSRFKPSTTGLVANANIASSAAIAASKIGTLNSANMPSGSLVQSARVVSKDTQVANNTTSYVQVTGLSIAFTPLFTNSIIEIFTQVFIFAAPAGANGYGINIFKDNTRVSNSPNDTPDRPYDLYQDVSTRIIKYAWKQYYETSGSTSARTYDVRGKVYYPITNNDMTLGSSNEDGSENYLLIKEYKA